MTNSSGLAWRTLALLGSTLAMTLALSLEGAEAGHASVPDVTADESASTAVVHVNERDWGTGAHCTFNFAYSTQDGSATAGKDYEAVSGEGRMQDGRGSFRIPLIDDATEEGEETVRIVVVITDPSEYYVVGFCAGSAPAERLEATLTIVDDETRPEAAGRVDPPSSRSERAEAPRQRALPVGSVERDPSGAPVAGSDLTSGPKAGDFATVGAPPEVFEPKRSAEGLDPRNAADPARGGRWLMVATPIALALATGLVAAFRWRPRRTLSRKVKS